MQKKGRTRQMGRPSRNVAEKIVQAKKWKVDGDRLMKALVHLDISQNAFAKRAGITQGTLNHYANGRRGLTVNDLRRIAAAGISADFLFGVTDVLLVPNASRTFEELGSDVAKHLTMQIALRAKGQPWAAQLAEVVPDGAEFLRVGIERELSLIEEAWKEAEAAVLGGATHLSHALFPLELADAMSEQEVNPSARKRREPSHEQWVVKKRSRSKHRLWALGAWVEMQRQSIFSARWRSSVLRPWTATGKKGRVPDLALSRNIPKAFTDLSRHGLAKGGIDGA